MSCFDGGSVFILAGRKLHATKLEPQNLPPTKTCQLAASYPMCISMIRQSDPLKHIPLKQVTFWELCFGAMLPNVHFDD
jgi:hypothetical protein